MIPSRFSDSQILAILKQAEDGVPVTELCREHGMSSAAFYKWREKYGGMDASLMARMNELEKENTRLKRMYADVQLRRGVLQEALTKSGKPSLRAEMARKAVLCFILTVRQAVCGL